MKWYKGWSPKERYASLQKTKIAIKEGIIPKPDKCNRCGQVEGIIHYHNHDYSDPIKYLEMLCWRCHMMHHSVHRHPKSVELYFKQIKEGKMFPAVHHHLFSILDVHWTLD